MRTNVTTLKANGTRGARKNGRMRLVRLSGDAGSTLVAVIAIVTSVLLIGAGIFAMGTGESHIVECCIDQARAFYVAEGGLERARGWLGDLHLNDPGANPVGASFEGQLLGGGHYAVTVTEDLSGSGWLPAYEVVSTAEHDGVARQLRTVMVPETYARYQWLVESGAWKWFCDCECLQGPVHVNGDLQIDGNPWFGSRVTASAGLAMSLGSDPTFAHGYELNVPAVSMPDSTYFEDVLEAAALNGGLHAGTLTGVSSFYVIALGEPSPSQLTYEGRRPNAGGYFVIDGPHVVDLTALNGAVWFGSQAALSGVVDGQITIGVDGDIEIWGDVLYDGSTPGVGPDPDCDDALGVVAVGDIIISYTTANQNNCEVHGVLMALEGNVEAEDYLSYVPRGEFLIYGGTIAEQEVHLGNCVDGACTSGYTCHYHQDARLVRTPPPYFPLTGRYVINSWEEVAPALPT